MALRKSPARTAAMLAANSANAKKSTGPSTPQGKARVALNPLQHGGYAVRLPEKLLRADYQQDEAQYRWFRREITAAFAVGLPDDEEQADRMAAKVWCAARDLTARGAKPEYPFDSESSGLRVPVRLRIAIVDRARRIGLTFWLQRPRYWTRQRQERAMPEEELFAPTPGGRHEERWRRLRFRSRKPTPWEGWMLKHEARGRGRSTPADQPDEANATPAPPASPPRPPLAHSVASKSLPPRVDGLPDSHPPAVVHGTVLCRDPNETWPQALDPTLQQVLRLARQYGGEPLLAALREEARSCDLDFLGLASALLWRALESAGQGLRDGVKNPSLPLVEAGFSRAPCRNERADLPTLSGQVPAAATKSAQGRRNLRSIGQPR